MVSVQLKYGTVSGSFDGTIDDSGATGTLSGGFSLTANGEGFSGSLSADVSSNGITDGAERKGVIVDLW